MANSSFREVSHIAKFNGKNFSLWKFGCWLLLEQHNLVGIVNGEEPFPDEVFILFITNYHQTLISFFPPYCNDTLAIKERLLTNYK
jgi:hypothetical protein